MYKKVDPKTDFQAVEKGIIECLPHGVLAGYPVIRMKAVLTDGSYHEVDSSEAAFKSAAEIAFKEGMKAAKPAILEPYSKLRIGVPEQYLGDVLGDLNKRRGRIIGMDAQDDIQVITAEAPKAETKPAAKVEAPKAETKPAAKVEAPKTEAKKPAAKKSTRKSSK